MKSRRAAKRKPRQSLIVDAATSARLSEIRQHGTTPELEVRKILRSMSIAYRTSNRDLPGSPDLANRSKKWAIFVHGCFWHRHEQCHRSTTPKRNRTFWLEKFNANVARDKRAIARLQSLGYRVLTLWECDIELRQAKVAKALRQMLPKRAS